MKRQLVSAMIVGVFAVLALGSTDGDSPPAEKGEAEKANLAAGTPAARRYTHFAHGTLNVRSGPGERYRVVRTLARGDSLRLGEPDARGWARLLGADSAYVYARSSALKPERPVRIPSYEDEGPCAEKMQEVHAERNRRPDEIKRFEEAGLTAVTWWYRERPRDTYPKWQITFTRGPYLEGCEVSTVEN
jgi:hypothetical protein